MRTAEKLEAWAADLEPTVGVVAVHPQSGLDLPQQKVLATIEPDHNVRRIFSVGAPGAVLLGADGYLAGGPVAGEDEVAEFVEDVFAAITEQPRPTA
ncbi:hypothetical protein NOCA1130084 [metagenome]|uniref:Uncharacterized protein n=1 Tax=metagenome TaxID=256318 RepID=A0A2P2C6B8_9ZZZZ